MERQKWLAERRAALAAAYDAETAAYDDERHPWDMQREWVARVLGLIPPGGTVLDAPCGTGKYFAMLAAAGHRVAGADQSAGMPARARAGPDPGHRILNRPGFRGGFSCWSSPKIKHNTQAKSARA
jgi:SAM-dependent methyltransferase